MESSCVSIPSESQSEELEPWRVRTYIVQYSGRMSYLALGFPEWTGRGDRSSVLPGGVGIRCGCSVRIRICSLHLLEAVLVISMSADHPGLLHWIISCPWKSCFDSNPQWGGQEDKGSEDDINVSERREAGIRFLAIERWQWERHNKSLH